MKKTTTPKKKRDFFWACSCTFWELTRPQDIQLGNTYLGMHAQPLLYKLCIDTNQPWRQNWGLDFRLSVYSPGYAYVVRRDVDNSLPASRPLPWPTCVLLTYSIAFSAKENRRKTPAYSNYWLAPFPFTAPWLAQLWKQKAITAAAAEFLISCSRRQRERGQEKKRWNGQEKKRGPWASSYPPAVHARGIYLVGHYVHSVIRGSRREKERRGRGKCHTEKGS